MSAQTESEHVNEGFGGLHQVPHRVRQAISVLGFLVVWWALVNFRVLGFGYLGGPIETLRLFVVYLAGQPITSGKTIYYHAAYSTYRVIVGIGAAIVTAVPLGLAIGTSRRFEDYTFPALELIRPIPPVAWVPISILIVPAVAIGGFTINFAVLFVVYIGAFFPILINTIEGVGNVEEEYVRAAESLGAEGREVFRHVILPAAFPSILTGISIGVGLGWITVVAAEIIAGNYGLGYAIYHSYRLLQTDVVLVGMVAIGILGYVSSVVVNRLGNRAMPWADIDA